MTTAGTVLASGTRVSIDYVREHVRGTQPLAVDVPVTNIGVDITPVAQFDFQRTTGSWITDGFLVGDIVAARGFTNALINATWVVAVVAATDLTVTDTGDTITTNEAASVDRTVSKRVSENIEAVAAGAQGAGFSIFRRASGSWIDDGYEVGQQVTGQGFATAANNATFVVSIVDAPDLEVVDSGDVIVNDAAAVDATVFIELIKLRTTSRAINLEKDTLESAEVRASRQVSDLRHGFNRVVGSPGFQMSTLDYDDWLEHALSSFWGTVATVGSPDLEMDKTGASANRSDIIRATGSFKDDGYRPGDVIDSAGFVTAVNNTRLTVLAISTDTNPDDTLEVSDPTNVLVDDASATGPTVVYPGKRLDIGARMFTTTIQRRFDDIRIFQIFHGCVANTLNESIQPEAMIGGTIDILGMSSDPVRTSPIGGPPIAASNNSPYAAFDGSLHEGLALIAIVTGFDYALANNRELAPVVGSKFSPSVFEGTATITGTFNAFFLDQILLNKFVDETESSIFSKLDDINGVDFQTRVFPRVKYNGSDIDPPQQGPVPLAMPFQALESSENGVGSTTVATSMFIQRSNA